ncbi:ubiquinone/menaquinone biosynthesis C-methylase UbiE [Paenibacillus cellulosilyticus]|uniref:Ubiquinone/menaquinone biosynthesis C-methylase UbiE n=1 Tax=Paenibacillus cellulosilyticus TaxID=375489 RepID=A0A2V2YZC0_9BACL|nr:class I SAM-dependent methyltransferase [Paenibacillus cellulosilyticus]PWW06175.1 ubiquinone/menaquinone biosynthesis C-methylase UbiE [Paenibacillus cellulosilyticus]QKS43058.1 class I SAM-dependent methyltransferase [Paenibacillus cellulosilyticus]
MKQNKYDDQTFFSAYEQMPRSIDGLKAAGEWHILQALLPDLRDKRVLDLGCGFGWHCRYAREQQASEVVGVDISANMLKRAEELTNDPHITYVNSSIEDIGFEGRQFDVVLSSLAFHYIEAFDDACANIYGLLAPGGTFLFSVEHPIFTARDEQDWHYDEKGERLHWPVDRYQSEGMRDTSFLTDNVIKYHRTVSTYMNSLIRAGFRITAVKESVPSPAMMHIPGMADELRRPMFLIVAAVKL